ncbi:hypothetical protein QOZ91_001172, partial [Clostridium sardiniense]|nr:hypothetical protein [Clostridium sardiniense]
PITRAKKDKNLICDCDMVCIIYTLH